MKMQVQVTGKGVPVVLVPGGLTGWVSWEPHALRLSATRTVIRVQLLNVQLGLENRPLPKDYSVKLESRALASTLEELAIIHPVDFVAWSYGAEVTLNYALDYPERIRTLTLIEPPAIWVLRAAGPLDGDTQKAIAQLDVRSDSISEEVLEGFARNVGLLLPGKRGRDLPQWPQWMKHRQSLRNNPYAISHEDKVARLANFRIPVLLVKGTDSAPFLHGIIDGLAQRLPNAEVIEMPAGHAPQIVSMDRFLEKLESFHAEAVRV